MHSVPGSDTEAVEIRPKFFAQQDVTLQRIQLPLVSCWAATIHKVQGLSFSAVIDLGPNMFEDAPNSLLQIFPYAANASIMNTAAMDLIICDPV